MIGKNSIFAFGATKGSKVKYSPIAVWFIDVRVRQEQLLCPEVADANRAHQIPRLVARTRLQEDFDEFWRIEAAVNRNID